MKKNLRMLRIVLEELPYGSETLKLAKENPTGTCAVSFGKEFVPHDIKRDLGKVVLHISTVVNTDHPKQFRKQLETLASETGSILLRMESSILNLINTQDNEKHIPS